MRCLSRISAPKSGVVSASRSHLLLRRLTCEVKADFPLLRLIFFFLFSFVVPTGEYKQHKERGRGGKKILTLLLLGLTSFGISSS